MALPRLLRLIAAPAAVFQDQSPPARPVLHHLLFLSAIPAIAWPIGISMFPLAGVRAVHAPPAASIALGLSTYVLCVASAGLLALVLYSIAPMYKGRRDWGPAFSLAVDAATPVLLAGILLLYPPLILAALLAASYGLYLMYLGVQGALGVHEGDAAECSAICAMAFVFLSGTLGAVVSAAGLI